MVYLMNICVILKPDPGYFVPVDWRVKAQFYNSLITDMGYFWLWMLALVYREYILKLLKPDPGYFWVKG